MKLKVDDIVELNNTTGKIIEVVGGDIYVLWFDVDNQAGTWQYTGEELERINKLDADDSRVDSFNRWHGEFDRLFKSKDKVTNKDLKELRDKYPNL